jgi:hypothetical protein
VRTLKKLFPVEIQLTFSTNLLKVFNTYLGHKLVLDMLST